MGNLGILILDLSACQCSAAEGTFCKSCAFFYSKQDTWRSGQPSHHLHLLQSIRKSSFSELQINYISLPSFSQIFWSQALISRQDGRPPLRMPSDHAGDIWRFHRQIIKGRINQIARLMIVNPTAILCTCQHFPYSFCDPCKVLSQIPTTTFSQFSAHVNIYPTNSPLLMGDGGIC